MHPHNKTPVGDRLARIALANVYGRKIEYSGPMYESMKVEGGAIRVKFSHLGGGLVAKGGPLKGFQIAGADQKFVDARRQNRWRHRCGQQPAGERTGGGALRLGQLPGGTGLQPFQRRRFARGTLPNGPLGIPS